MKQLFLLVFGTISLLFVDAQSQTISGTLLPKKGESVTYLPKATDVQKVDANKQSSQQQPQQADTVVKKTVVKKVIHTGNEKPVVKTKVPAAKVPFDSKGFIFSLPVVQGKNNTVAAETVAPSANETPKPVEASKANPVIKPVVPVVASPSQTIANNPVSATTKKADNEPLKYEEPPVGTSGAWSAPPNNTAAAKLEPLVYGPPPVANTAAPSGDNNTIDKKASLRSPKFKGVYKPEPKKPILMTPMSPDEMEDGVPKKKETEPTANVVEKPKSVEDLYPPLNYTAPIPASASNLRSPKIQGAYVASKNNPMILMPVPPEPTNGQQQNGSTLVYQEPPVQTNNTNVTPSRTEQASSSQPNIFDENYRGKPAVASKPIYSKYKKAAPKSISTTAIKSSTVKPATSNKPVNAPVQKPVKNNFKKTFLKPVRQSVNSGVSFNYQQLFNILKTDLALAVC